MDNEIVLKNAISQLGVKEHTNNDTIYGRWFGLNHQPWCAMFVSWCFNQAGLSALVAAQNKKGFASCASGLAYFKKKRQLVDAKSAQPGDIVFFQFDDDPQPDHVGIVERVLPKGQGLVTIEGNTSSDRGGSQSNGDGVFRRNRPFSLVAGVARPYPKG